ncbi:MAG: acyl-CoA thioesterase [Pseudomonadales bacterium]
MANDASTKAINISTIHTETVIDIPFYDVDSMNVVWHGHYVKYIEVARCELLESLGYNYDAMHESGYAWPVVDMRIKYVKPVRFKQKIVIESKLVEWENRIKINYTIRDKDNGERLTKAYSIQMAVNVVTGDALFESPGILRALLEKSLDKAGLS